MPLDDAPVKEKRNIENPAVPITNHVLFQSILAGFKRDVGKNVSLAQAMRVPAYANGRGFLSKTIAKLPLQTFSRTKDGTKKETNTDLSRLLKDQVNDNLSSFKWRQHGVGSLIDNGVWLSYVERRTPGGTPVNIFPLEASKTTIKRSGFDIKYHYKNGNRTQVYDQADIIHVAWDIGTDPILDAVSPFNAMRNAIGLYRAIDNYGGGLFKNGGMPPMALHGPFVSGDGVRRASDDVTKAVKQAANEGSQILPLPMGHELKPLGFNPEDAQMVELKRYLIEEFARGFTLPPVFLQDLTNGTFSNTEQQDLALVKHTLTNILTAIEAELMLKLFPRRNRTRFVRFNVDALLRGAFSERMKGYQSAINAAVLTPAQAHDLENLPEGAPETKKHYMQGANLPLDKLGVMPPAKDPPPKDDDDK